MGLSRASHLLLGEAASVDTRRIPNNACIRSIAVMTKVRIHIKNSCVFFFRDCHLRGVDLGHREVLGRHGLGPHDVPEHAVVDCQVVGTCVADRHRMGICTQEKYGQGHA